MDVSPAKRSYFTCANVWWKLLFHSTRFCERYKPCKMLKKDALLVDMYPEFWTHIYKLGGHHGCFSVFYRRHPFCFCLDSFAIIVINIFINSNCKFFK